MTLSWSGVTIEDSSVPCDKDAEFGIQDFAPKPYHSWFQVRDLDPRPPVNVCSVLIRRSSVPCVLAHELARLMPVVAGLTDSLPPQSPSKSLPTTRAVSESIGFPID